MFETDAAVAALRGLTDAAQVPVDESTLVLLVRATAPRRERECIVHAAIEGLRARRVLLQPTACAVLYNAGVTTGVVVDAGHWETRIVPVVDGSVDTDLVARCNVGGAAQVTVLREVLRGPALNAAGVTLEGSSVAASSAATLRDLEATLSLPRLQSLLPGCCAQGAITVGSSAQVSLTLPDGELLGLDVPIASLRATGDVLFEPSRFVSGQRATDAIDLSGSGIALTAAATLRALAVKRLTAAQNAAGNVAAAAANDSIVVPPLLWTAAGGPVATPWIEERLRADIGRWALHPRPQETDAGAGARVTYSRTAEPLTGAWAGAALLSQIGSFQAMCVDRASYSELGPDRCVRRMMD